MNISQNQYGPKVGYYPGYAGNRVGSPAKKEEKEEKSYREQILEKMEEMAQNIRKGTIQPKFRIGAQEYTVREWEKLLEKFDAAEEVLREAVEEQAEEVRKQAEEEDGSETKLVTKPDGSTVLQIRTAYDVMEVEVTKAQKFGLLVDVKADVTENSVTENRNETVDNPAFSVV